LADRIKLAHFDPIAQSKFNSDPRRLAFEGQVRATGGFLGQVQQDGFHSISNCAAR
jgi:hypothetical protein